MLLFLPLPAMVNIARSFSDSSFPACPIEGWSMQWYEAMWNSEKRALATRNSFIVAPLATLLATVLDMLAAMGLAHTRFSAKRVLTRFLIAPMVVPIVVVGVSSYLYFAHWGPGARFGPRQIRAESRLILPCKIVTGAAPFNTLQVADLADVPINIFNLEKSVNIIEQHYRSIVDSGCIPMTLGGGHAMALPILRAVSLCGGRRPVARQQGLADRVAWQRLLGRRLRLATATARYHRAGA